MILEQDELIKMLVANIYSTGTNVNKVTAGKSMGASKTFSGSKMKREVDLENQNAGNSDFG